MAAWKQQLYEKTQIGEYEVDSTVRSAGRWLHGSSSSLRLLRLVIFKQILLIGLLGDGGMEAIALQKTQICELRQILPKGLLEDGCMEAAALQETQIGEL